MDTETVLRLSEIIKENLENQNKLNTTTMKYIKHLNERVDLLQEEIKRLHRLINK